VIPAGFEQSVEARIAASLPEVSYSVTSPQFPDLVYETSVDGEKTLDRDRIQGWIRELESLDGSRPVVCRTVEGNVFGQCMFPVSNLPAEDTPADTMKE